MLLLRRQQRPLVRNQVPMALARASRQKPRLIQADGYSSATAGLTSLSVSPAWWPVCTRLCPNRMLSPCTAVAIRQALGEAGYEVWLDLERMSGQTIEAMADAVEHAAVVVLIASRRYRESENCRSEACYAYQKRRPIIPVMAQERYSPEGWLGFVMGTRLYVDFSAARPRGLGGARGAADGIALARAPPVFAGDSDAAAFARCMRGLMRELADRGRSGSGRGTDSSRVSDRDQLSPDSRRDGVFQDTEKSTPSALSAISTAPASVVPSGRPSQSCGPTPHALKTPLPLGDRPALVGPGCGVDCVPAFPAQPPSQTEAAPAHRGQPGARRVSLCQSCNNSPQLCEWALAASGSHEAAALMGAAGMDGAALAELARVCAEDEGLALRLLREDVGIVALGPRLRIAAALRRLPLSDG